LIKRYFLQNKFLAVRSKKSRIFAELNRYTTKMGNIVAIVGRPNVGKSTLFNRLTGERKAIVHEESGVTRDRHYGKSFWNGVEFSVIDTGGYVQGSEDIFEEEIRKQVVLAVEESDVIIFVVDTQVGVTDLDEIVARMLRKIPKPVFLMANKVDNIEQSYMVYDFHRLGVGEPYPVSSVSGAGTGELLDDLVKKLQADLPLDDPELPRIAIVGRPNVGKSSLLNAFTGEERNIVTPISGTTRDSINTRFNKFGYDFILTDTAGLRKKTKVQENVEFYSVMRSVRVIENSDVCILMLDAQEGVLAQDMNIFRLIQNNRKGVVVVINKWDLVEKETNTMKDFEAEIRHQLEPFTDVPIIFTSVTEKQRIHRALEAAMEVFENRKRHVPGAQLNDVMLQEIEKYPPPSQKGKYVKIKYVSQLPTYAPTFAFYCNFPQFIKDPYKRYLENRLREHFKFTGVPVQIFFRKK